MMIVCLYVEYRCLDHLPNRRICMIRPLFQLSMKYLKVLTVQYLRTARLVLGKHIQWKENVGGQRSVFCCSVFFFF